MIHIGLDIGGTKISAIALNESGKELARQRVPTPQDYESILSTCAAFVYGFEKDMGEKSTLGMGSPGAIDTHQGLIRFSPNVPAMRGKYLARDLSARIGAPVRLANDAVCFVLSEATDGAAAQLNRIYGVILGTGVGGALVEGARFDPGPNTFMEWGHITLPYLDKRDEPLPRCGCGRAGCVEAYLSGRALNTQISEAVGRDLTHAGMNEAIAKAMPAVIDVMEIYLNRLAKALSMLITAIDPDALVLGGGVSNLDILYTELPKRIGKYTVVPEIKTKILKAKFGDDSGLRGAAWLGAGAK